MTHKIVLAASRSTWGRTALTSVRRNAFRFWEYSTVRRTAAPTASYFRKSSASIRSGARGAGSLTYAMTSSSCSSGTEQYRNTSSRVAGRDRCFSNRTTASAKPSIFATWMRSSATFLPDCAGSYAGSRACAGSNERSVSSNRFRWTRARPLVFQVTLSRASSRNASSYDWTAASSSPARSSEKPRMYQRALSVGRATVAWARASAAAGNCSTFTWRRPLPRHASPNSGAASIAESKAAEVEQNSAFRREGAAVSRIQVQGLIVCGQRLLRSAESPQERAFRIPRPSVHRVHAARPVERLHRGIRLSGPFEGAGQFPQRLGVPCIDLEEPLADIGGGLERMVGEQQVAFHPEVVRMVRRDRGRLRDGGQGVLCIAGGLRETRAPRPSVRVLGLGGGQSNGGIERVLRPSEGLQGGTQPGECRGLLRVLGQHRLEHRDRLLVSVQLREARPLFQEGRRHRRGEGGRFPVGRRSLFVSLEPVQRGAFTEPRFCVIRVECEGAVERRDRLFVALLALQGEAEEIPAFHISRCVPRRPIEAVDRVRECVESIMGAPFLVPQARGGRVCLDGDVERLHRIGVASEREQQGRLPRGGVRGPGIEPEDGVERGDRFL